MLSLIYVVKYNVFKLTNLIRIMKCLLIVIGTRSSRNYNKYKSLIQIKNYKQITKYVNNIIYSNSKTMKSELHHNMYY